MGKESYLEKIIECAEKYQSQLLNKAILFIYQNVDGVNSIEVRFKNVNFKHLTGVKSRLDSDIFFNKCINHRLDVSSYQPTSFTPLKLSVFDTFVHIHENPATIGEFDGANLLLQLDIVVAKSQTVLGLSKDSSDYYFPVTLLKEGNYFNIMKSQSPVLMTFIKNIYSARAEYSPSYIKMDCKTNEIISKLPIEFAEVIKRVKRESL
jgi:hypothetical protein